MTDSESPSNPVKPTSAIVWAMPEQVDCLKPIFEWSGVQVIGAGCPIPAQSGTIASAIGCAMHDDLRHVLSTESPDLILLASTSGFAQHDAEQDFAALENARSREITVATLEPLPSRPGVLGSPGWGDPTGMKNSPELAVMVPMIRQSRLIDELMTVLETFGPIRSMSISLSAPSVFGSLGARVFETMDLIRTLVGVPQLIDASYQSAHRLGSSSGIHPLPGQSLRDLEGILTSHLRMPDGRGVVLQVTDQVGISVFEMSILGSDGQILLNDQGFKRFDEHGSLIDSFEMSTDREHDPTASRMSEQLIQLCSGVGPIRAPIDQPSVIAMGHAALLSVRTGQGETPSTIRKLLMEV